MKTMKKLSAFILVLAILCGTFAVNASAVTVNDGDIQDITISDGTYNNAVATLRSMWDGVIMKVATDYNGSPDDEYYVVSDGKGNSMLSYDLTGDATTNIYYADINGENPLAVIYAEDIAPQPDGWYGFDSSSFEFYMLYSPIVDFVYLATKFNDSCFDISTSGSTTTLTAKAEYVNEIAYAYFGNFSNVDEGVTDVYNSLVIKIKDGVLYSLTANNVYTTPEGSATYDYTVTFEEGGFEIPEYSDYLNLYEIPNGAANLPFNETVTINGEAWYVFTPERNTTLNLSSTESNGADPYLEICVASEYDGYCLPIDIIDDSGLTVLSFDKNYFFAAGTTYYIYLGDYNENTGYEFTTEEFLFRGSDVTGDGKAGALDASYILQYDAGLMAFTDEQIANADANKDGRVSALDASLFLQYDAMLLYAAE